MRSHGGGFGLGEGGGAAVGVGALVGAGAWAAPGDGVVAVEVDAVVAAAVFAPEAAAAPGVLVAVGVDDGDDPEGGAIEEGADRGVAVGVAQHAVGDAGGDHGADPFARVLGAGDQEGSGCGGVADAESADGAAFDRAADRVNGCAVGGELEELDEVRGDRVVVVVLGKPVGWARGGGVAEARGFGGGCGVDVEDEDLPGNAGGVELGEGVVGDDDVEGEARAAMLAPDIERQ